MLFRKLLIANRGEIACRIVRSAKKLGIPTAAVYSTADRNALHTQLADEAIEIGEARPSESYLNVSKIIKAAQQCGADSIHPGYGFLSENSELAESCLKNSIEFIGPSPHAIQTMASKSTSMSIAKQAGVPVLPGFRDSTATQQLMFGAAREIGYPILLKSALGGGGRGMRIVDNECDFEHHLKSARAESLESFGDDSIIIEKYLTQSRHVEVQVAGDKLGNVVHLFDRDCSAQRRYQKIIEEAPAPNIDAGIKQKMYEAAISITKALSYYSVGTIEFLFEGDAFYFIEMNTRLQVEHPVTEQITDCDLVEWQIRIAAGESIDYLRIPEQPLRHSVEARIYAENPSRDFLPSPGLIQHLHFPDASKNLQVHTGIVEGDLVDRFYDPMIAKIVCSGENRSKAIQTMINALEDLRIAGLATNTAFLIELMQTEAFSMATIDTNFVEANLDSLIHRDQTVPVEILIMAALSIQSKSAQNRADRSEQLTQEFRSPWSANSGWRINSEREIVVHIEHSNQISNVSLCYSKSGLQVKCGASQIDCEVIQESNQKLVACLDGIECSVTVVELENQFAIFHRGSCYELRKVDKVSVASADVGLTGSLTAPLPGRVSRILVSEGESVEVGQNLMVLEAMKMEHPLKSPIDGVVISVNYSENEQVEEDATCLVVKAVD